MLRCSRHSCVLAGASGGGAGCSVTVSAWRPRRRGGGGSGRIGWSRHGTGPGRGSTRQGSGELPACCIHWLRPRRIRWLALSLVCALGFVFQMVLQDRKGCHRVVDVTFATLFAWYCDLLHSSRPSGMDGCLSVSAWGQRYWHRCCGCSWSSRLAASVT